MDLKLLRDLYVYELKELHSAEKQIIKALPKLARAAGSPGLEVEFQKQLEESTEHAARLGRILSIHDQTPHGPKCRIVEAIIAEGAEMIEEEANEEYREAALVSAVKRMKNHLMAAYRAARTNAVLLGDLAGARILQRTLEEKTGAARKVTAPANFPSNLATSR